RGRTGRGWPRRQARRAGGEPVPLTPFVSGTGLLGEEAAGGLSHRPAQPQVVADRGNKCGGHDPFEPLDVGARGGHLGAGLGHLALDPLHTLIQVRGSHDASTPTWATPIRSRIASSLNTVLERSKTMRSSSCV